ncbi:Kelch repeat-containing protein [Streptomyces chiangmaiensis]|uniref:Uncharacterized protein n=1 Tax=Streptomyces chiangmaiensis TaxID=766497 RepID=A0ABU7FDB4_9ACTN|nr:hypothetical protein [Streptomyces chiangmaiensis]MED7822162.1 hypothetical protein [Streptomyces chiangmaiensis]
MATLLDNCQVATEGGSGDTGFLASAELYNPRTGTSHTTESMHEARETTTATLLDNGKVLVASGHNDTGGLTSSELYNPNGALGTGAGAHQGSRVEEAQVNTMDLSRLHRSLTSVRAQLSHHAGLVGQYEDSDCRPQHKPAVGP